MATGETQTNVCPKEKRRETERERERARWTHTSCRICVARTLAVAVKKSQPLGTRWGCLQRLTVTLGSPHQLLLLLLLVTKLQMARHQCEWVQANVAALPKWAATFWGHTSLEANLKPEKSQAEKLPEEGSAGGRGCQCCKPLTKTLLIPLQLVHVCSTWTCRTRWQIRHAPKLVYGLRQKGDMRRYWGGEKATRYPCRVVA